ncbi:MAG: RNA-binding protein [Thermoanaerobaculaceae bacterium]|nr:RNA-binding protein [Thermoanaerobaculaceae bacterium]
MKLYVGNLSYDTNEAELRDLFTPFGEVPRGAGPRHRRQRGSSPW